MNRVVQPGHEYVVAEWLTPTFSGLLQDGQRTIWVARAWRLRPSLVEPPFAFDGVEADGGTASGAIADEGGWEEEDGKRV